MKPSEPITISVVTAVYNRVGTIGEALQSVAGQDYPHVEHVIQDGGSDDGPLDVLAWHDDRLVSLVSARDYGLYDAINRAMARPTCKVVGLLHSYDLFADP